MRPTFLLLSLLLSLSSIAQEVKNVILLIPDGCSIASVSAARWYQWLTCPDREHLAIDPYLCGTVRTTCSNAPIGDSAPTTSCYMTGYTSLKGWVATYPTADPANDIIPIDPSRAYQPLATVLEAAKLQGRRTGLVCTCEFPQATPADCASHSYDRGKYDWIAPQQAHNDVDVLIGGGTSQLGAESEAYLKDGGWTVLKDDLQAMRQCKADRLWALFGEMDMAYEADRDTAKEPSLAEMTDCAIEKLARGDKGFFLMVEGSKVDWGAHDNDPVAIIGDFLAFDRACAKALDFARRDGHTAVVILPDHGNSGLSIGRRDWGNYAGTSLRKTFGAMTQMRHTSSYIAGKVRKLDDSLAQKIYKAELGFELTDKELRHVRDRKWNNRAIAQAMTERTGLAFTTNGHTGEDVFLAAYHPEPLRRPTGMLTNVDINAYLCSLIGINRDTLDAISRRYYAPHTTALKGQTCRTDTTQAMPRLVVGKGKRTITLTMSSNIATVGTGKAARKVRLPFPVVYVDKNNTWYLPADLMERTLGISTSLKLGIRN